MGLLEWVSEWMGGRCAGRPYSCDFTTILRTFRLCLFAQHRNYFSSFGSTHPVISFLSAQNSLWILFRRLVAKFDSRIACQHNRYAISKKTAQSREIWSSENSPRKVFKHFPLIVHSFEKPDQDDVTTNFISGEMEHDERGRLSPISLRWLEYS